MKRISTRGKFGLTPARLAAATLLACSVATPVAASAALASPAEPTDSKAAIRTYILPGDEVFPEGIAVHGNQYYVTGFGFGEIFRGDLHEPEAEVFTEGSPDGHGGGIKVTGRRLVEARGSGGVAVYDRITGALVRKWSNGMSPDETVVNDVAIAPNGDAYLTDSFRPVLYRIPAAALRQPTTVVDDIPVFLEWEGTAFVHVPGAYNANGVVATPDGKHVLVVNFETGQLVRVRLSDKHVTQVDLGGYTLTGGDGMVLTEHNDLYVVRFLDSLVAKLRLTDQYRHAQLLSETTDPSFQGPTTAAIAGRRLLVVNSQFQGPGTPPFTVSSIPLP